MSDEKWDSLPYVLKNPTGSRDLILVSNFQATAGSWFDTGQYTVTENSVALGDIFVDLYSDRSIYWNGNADQFTPEETKEIVDYIIFGNLDGQEPF